MISVNLRGKEFPLCLTVAALDQINAKCGGLAGLNDFLAKRTENGEGKTLTEYRMGNVAWMLGVLIQEGEAHRLADAMFDPKGDKQSRAVPGPDTISHLLTPGTARKYVSAVYQAIHEGLAQEIEAEPGKNGESAEQA